jgi:hypothetical protein
MARHSNLKVLDLSWNSIGLSRNKAFAHKLADTFQTQENLVHLDLSHNQLKKEDCSIIAQGLAQNHSLWGFHILGNDGHIDAKGFLTAEKESSPGLSLAAEHLTHRINGRRMVTLHHNPITRESNSDNCWICEGWNEVLFEWPSRIFGQRGSSAHGEAGAGLLAPRV